MKTETNLYLRSLIGEKKAALCEAHDEDLRKLNDALTELRTEATQKQPCSTVPPLSEKTINIIRYLLEFSVDIAKEDLNRTKTMPPILNSYCGEQLVIRLKQSRIDKVIRTLSEFNAAYPAKESK